MAELVRVVLLTMHLLLAAAACATPAVAGILALRRSLRAEFPDIVSKLIAWGVYAQLGGALVGGMSAAAILAAEDEHYLSVVSRIPAYDFAMLISEWFFTLILLGVLAWLASGGVKRPQLFAFVSFVAVTNFAYHFPTIMSVIGVETYSPTLTVDEPLDRAAYRQLITRPVMIARTLHFWALAVTTGGALLAAATMKERRSRAGRPLATLAARGVLAGLCLQSATGVLTLSLLPAASIQAMTGDDLLTTASLVIVVAIACVLTYRILPAAFGATTRLETKQLLAMLALATLLMTWSTSRSRAEAGIKKPLDQRHASAERF